MANNNHYKSILREIKDFNSILNRDSRHPAPIIPEIQDVWEWEDNTGLPIFPALIPVWQRHFPVHLMKRSHGGSEPFATTQVGQQFMNGMRSNRETFTVNYSLNGNAGNGKRGLLKMIYRGDFKKIKIVDGARQQMIITKNNNVLLDYDVAHPQQALLASGKGFEDLITEINANATRGYLGPGTYWCREPLCENKPRITSSPIVKWGPGRGQVFFPRKRFFCNGINVVYNIYCQACKDLGLWTSYVGESFQTPPSNFHNRMVKHLSEICDQTNRNNYNRKETFFPEFLRGIIRNGDPDPDQLIRDIFFHFNYIHSPEDRRITILDGNFPTTLARKRHETLYQREFGNYNYFPNGTGSLNKFI